MPPATGLELFLVLVSTKMALLTELGAAAAGDDRDVEMDWGSVTDADMDSPDKQALPRETFDLCQYSGLTRFGSHLINVMEEFDPRR
jgi:hypothetical protein